MINKKAQGQSFWVIVTIIIALVVVVLVILWFSKSGSKGFGAVEDQLSGLSDCDKDGVSDMFDKCPCDAVIGSENPNVKGCPQGMPSTPGNMPACCIDGRDKT